MKGILIITLSLLTFNIYSQIVKSQYTTQNYTIKEYIKDDYLKKTWPKAVLMFVAGACDGQVETLLHHYPAFKKTFPNVNDQNWNPNTSWKNKYKDGNKENGDAYFLSSTVLVSTTDAYHAFKMGQKACIFTAVAIDLCNKKYRHEKKLKHYLVDMIFYSASYTTGFYATYKLIY